MPASWFDSKHTHENGDAMTCERCKAARAVSVKGGMLLCSPCLWELAKELVAEEREGKVRDEVR